MVKSRVKLDIVGIEPTTFRIQHRNMRSERYTPKLNARLLLIVLQITMIKPLIVLTLFTQPPQEVRTSWIHDLTSWLNTQPCDRCADQS